MTTLEIAKELIKDMSGEDKKKLCDNLINILVQYQDKLQNEEDSNA